MLDETLPFKRTDNILDILAVLTDAYQKNNDPYGAEISRATGRATGSITPALKTLQDNNWVTSYWDIDDTDPGPRRRRYRLNPDKATLAATITESRRKTGSTKS